MIERLEDIANLEFLTIVEGSFYCRNSINTQWIVRIAHSSIDYDAIATAGDTGSGNAGKLVILDGAGKVADANLSSNVPLINASNSFTGRNTFASGSLLTSQSHAISQTWNASANTFTAFQIAIVDTASQTLSRLASAVVNGTEVFSVTKGGAVTANSFAGSGVNLTSLSASNITGTLADGLLSANVPLINANNTFSGDNHFSGAVYFANQASRALTRTLPTVVGNGVDIGSFTFTNGTAFLDVELTISAATFSQSKRFQIPVTYNATLGTWHKVYPTLSSQRQGGQDADLDINVNAGTCSLRLRRTAGTVAANATMTLFNSGTITDTFAPSTTSSAVTAPTAIYFYTRPNMPTFSPHDYGAKGDGVYVYKNAALASGTNTLTLTGGALTAADVGKLIKVDGAGTGGAGFNNDLVTSIATVVDATHATLSANATTSVTTASIIYGTDDTAAIQAATDAAGAALGGVVKFNNLIYIVGGAYVPSVGATSGSTNAQIVVVARDLATQETISIELVGSYGGDNTNWVPGEDQPLCNHGTVLWSLRSDATSGDNGIIGGAAPTGATWAFSAVTLKVSNMTIRSQRNANYSAINAGGIGGIVCMNLQIDSGVLIDQIYRRFDTIGSSAIILPKTNNWVLSVVDNVDICGFETAIRVAEHANIDRTRIYICNRALMLDSSNHAMMIKHAVIVNCRYAIYAGNGGNVEMSCVSIEHGGNLMYDPITGTTSGTMTDIYDPSSVIRGHANLNIVSDVINVANGHAKNFKYNAMNGQGPMNATTSLASSFDLFPSGPGVWVNTGLQTNVIFSCDNDVSYTVFPSVISTSGGGSIETKLVNSADGTDIANSQIQAAYSPSGAVPDVIGAINVDSPLALFTCAEASGLVWTDSSGNARNGTINSAGVTYGSAGPLHNQPSKALGFNGSTGYASAALSSLVSGTAHGSIEAWLYRAAGSNKAFIGFGGTSSASRFGILWNNDGLVYFEVEGAVSNYPNVAFNTTGWHHFAVTFDGSLGTAANRVVAYIDNVQQTLTPGGAGNPSVLASTANLATFDAGREVGTGTFGAQQCAFAALFATTLTAAKVNNHYQAGSMLINPAAQCRTIVRVGGATNLQLFARYNGAGVTNAMITSGSRIIATQL